LGKLDLQPVLGIVAFVMGLCGLYWARRPGLAVMEGCVLQYLQSCTRRQSLGALSNCSLYLQEQTALRGLRSGSAFSAALSWAENKHSLIGAVLMFWKTEAASGSGILF
jgi:hypothetical protein